MKEELSKAMALLMGHVKPNRQIGTAYSWATTEKPVHRHILNNGGPVARPLGISNPLLH